MARKRVLFICNHNSARSIMAEALLQTMYGDRYDVSSAGVDPGGVQRHTIEVLREEGLPTEGLNSKGMEGFFDLGIDIVVTVCDGVRESCPAFPGRGTRIHHSFADPEVFPGDEERTLGSFRAVRDDIRRWLTGEFEDPMERI